jgi:hypothetical protein
VSLTRVHGDGRTRGHGAIVLQVLLVAVVVLVLMMCGEERERDGRSDDEVVRAVHDNLERRIRSSEIQGRNALLTTRRHSVPEYCRLTRSLQKLIP